jgi:hypothetical protein
MEPIEERRKPTVERCQGCGREVKESESDRFVCEAYLDPNVFWRMGHCPLATHVSLGDKKGREGKTRVGQQKQRKRID